MSLRFTPVAVTHEDVPTYLRDRIARKLVVINRKLDKIGAPAAAVEFGPTYVHTWRDEESGIERSVKRFETVTVTGFEASHDGWTAIASLDHSLVPGEAFVTKFPGHEADEFPAKYRTTGPACDHCGLRINRKLTVLFRHEDGRWTQVGTSCVLEYLGIDPATILWLSTASAMPEGDEEGHRGSWYVSPLEFLAVCCEVQRGAGFIPSQEPGSNRETADDIARGTLRGDKLAKLLPDFDLKRGEADAATVVAWVLAEAATSTSEFITSASLAVRADQATNRTIGLLAALPYSMSKALERDVAKAAVVPSQFVGAVGGKIAVVGKAVVVRTIDGYYGSKKMIVVLTEAGERVMTFGTGLSLWNVREGETIRFAGKVKEHEDGKYGKTTVITMAKAEIAELVAA